MKPAKFVSLLGALILCVSFASAQVTDSVSIDSWSPCLNLTKDMRFGSKDSITGGQVSDLQLYLQEQGFLASEPTGYFGALTRRAVIKFQSKNGITGNGLVGPLTRGKINQLSCGEVSIDSQSENTTVKHNQGLDSAGNFGVTAGFVEKTISPNSTNVKIASFVFIPSGRFMPVSIHVMPNAEGYTLSNLSNLYVTLNGTRVGTPVGQLALSNKFSLVNSSFSASGINYIDVYADIGIATNGHVKPVVEMVLENLSGGNGSTVRATGVPVISRGVSGIGATLSSSSPLAQSVVGGSSFMIATYNLKAEPANTSAVVRELRFTTNNENAIESVTVAGMTYPMARGEAIATGLSIPISSSGVDVPVTVKFAGFLNSSTGGILTEVAQGVLLKLAYIEASTPSGSAISSPVAVHSNSMNVVPSNTTPAGSKPVARLSGSPVSNKDTLVTWSSENARSCTLLTESSDDYANLSAPLSGSKTVGFMQPVRIIKFTCLGADGVTWSDDKSLTIYGYSFASTSAFVLRMAVGSVPLDLGYDINKDGRITSADALMYQAMNTIPSALTNGDKSQLALRMSVGTAPTDLSYDLNQDGKVTSADALAFLRLDSQTATTVSSPTSSATITKPTVTVSADPMTIAYGSQTRITWSSQNATKCTWTEGDRQFTAYENTLSGTNRYTSSMYSSQRFTLTCENSAGSTSSSVTINVSSTTATTAGVVRGESTVCVDLPYNMHRGNETPNVKRLQNFLVTNGLLEETTGFYGDKTIAAVKAYQSAKGLPETGMVYDFTRMAIANDTCR